MKYFKAFGNPANPSQAVLCNGVPFFHTELVQCSLSATFVAMDPNIGEAIRVDEERATH